MINMMCVFAHAAQNVKNSPFEAFLVKTHAPNLLYINELIYLSSYSPDLEGFTGVGHSIEDCLYKARWGMEEHITLLREHGFPIPEPNPDPTVVIHNERRIEAVA